jgi:hypothetical protein
MKHYLNDLFWVIYDRLATFTQMGAYSLASAERGVATPTRPHLSLALRCRRV